MQNGGTYIRFDNSSNSWSIFWARPSQLSDSQWEDAKLELEKFGDIDVVHDENVFSQLSLLGAPWPVINLSAIQAACEIGIRGLQDERAIEISRRIFFRAMRNLLSSSAGEDTDNEPLGHVATPGGITERGLSHLTELSRTFESAFEGMQTRAEELSV